MTQFYKALETAFGDSDRTVTAQRFFFEEGLSSELRTLLIPTQAHNLSFTELKSLCQRMDNEHRRIKPFVSRVRANANATNNNYTAPRGPAPALAQPAVNMSTNNQVTAMNLSAMNARPRGPLTPELRQYRMDNKLCLYAGCTGHLAKDCPLLRPPMNEKPPYGP